MLGLRLGTLRPTCTHLSPRTTIPLVHSLCAVPYTILNTVNLIPRRSLTNRPKHGPDLFNYTSARWLYNDTLRHAERRVVFNVDELCRLAADSVGRKAADVVEVSKLAEGSSNRVFLITMADKFKMVARIPYSISVPKQYGIASEVATMDFLRSKELPIPEVYGYSFDPDNTAGTEYIFMEYVQATPLNEVWHSLSKTDMLTIVEDLAGYQAMMTSIPFQLGGSLYYTSDLKKIIKWPEEQPGDNRFITGPDTQRSLWSGRRAQLDVYRGPYPHAEAALSAPALKEMAYLERFGQPLLPFRRERRIAHRFKAQLPSDHVTNLRQYLRVIRSLIPSHPALHEFCVEHPDLRPSHVFVSQSADSTWRVASLIGWQQTSIRPRFLMAGLPPIFYSPRGKMLRSTNPPARLTNLGELHDYEKHLAKEVHRAQLAYSHYMKHTKEFHETHFAMLMDPTHLLRARLFACAGYPWQGEPLGLKVALIEATQQWEALVEDGTTCPVTFDEEDIRKTMELKEAQAQADEVVDNLKHLLQLGSDGWVSPQFHEEISVMLNRCREEGLAGELSEEEEIELRDHWFWDDMDEEEYM